MGMGTAPCHGFVLEATEEIMKTFGWTFEALKKHAKEEYSKSNLYPPTEDDLEDFDAVVQFLALESHILDIHKDGKTFDAQIMYYNREDGDRYDDLEDGIYLNFDENCLYEKKLTDIGELLKGIDLLPKEQQWTNFG
jgi:hypothetical protein